MKPLSRTLENKLGIGVAIGLIFFAVVAAVVTAAFAYQQEIASNRKLLTQLVGVVRAQAEVAVFAENREIANEIIEGLLANPLLLAVSIRANHGFTASGGQKAALTNAAAVTSYPLRAPTNAASEIGQIVVVMNSELVLQKAMVATLVLFFVVFLQVVLAAVLIIWISRRVIVQPITALAARINQIRPGSGVRVVVPDSHEDDEIGQLALNTNRLIDAHELVLAELRELATTDALTGVCNRRQFNKRMNDELARIQRLESEQATVLMLDIDHFKVINDTYGHPAGDAALAQLGTILRSIARRIDVVGRLGGEEFAVLLVGTGAHESIAFAERFRVTVAETPVVHEGREIHMTLSIGAATISATDPDTDAALARADKALYEAKMSGRNRVVMAPGAH